MFAPPAPQVAKTPKKKSRFVRVERTVAKEDVKSAAQLFKFLGGAIESTSNVMQDQVRWSGT